MFSYCWTENEHEKDYQKKTQDESVVRIAAAGCGGQNKNLAMYELPFVRAEVRLIFNAAALKFPIVGHSFIPPDLFLETSK